MYVEYAERMLSECGCDRMKKTTTLCVTLSLQTGACYDMQHLYIFK